jgi:hypothetical protein
MVRSSVAAQSKAQSRSAPREDPSPAMLAAPTEENAKTARAARRPRKGLGMRLWGFVRRHEDTLDNVAGSELLPQDIEIWYDRKRCRFQVISAQKVIDDLAPVEFVQFVRALRYSSTQILFKFDYHQDGTAGRPVRVWSPPI